MKGLMNLALVLAAWALYVDAIPMEQQPNASVEDVCNLLTSLSAEGQMLTKFNGVFFNDFKAGKNAGSKGPLAIGGAFIGENAFINQRNQLSCATETPSAAAFGHHGLILKGANNSPIKVNGFAYVQTKENPVTTSLHECSVKTAATNYDFDLTRANAMAMSRKLAGMLPNWGIDKMGIIVNIVAEGVSVKQPYNLFTMPVHCAPGPCQAKNYFDCIESHDCETPAQTLSDVHAMLLGKTSSWTGPNEQTYPDDKMLVINAPVMEDHTFDIQTKNPSAGINACNTIYNFYAVNQQGRYEPKGKFALKRSSDGPLSGMILAPQAHIVDSATGSVTGQVIADGYEGADGVQIQDYLSAGNEQCQSFTGCAVIKTASKLVRRQNDTHNPGSISNNPTSSTGTTSIRFPIPIPILSIFVSFVSIEDPTLIATPISVTDPIFTFPPSVFTPTIISEFFTPILLLDPSTAVPITSSPISVGPPITVSVTTDIIASAIIPVASESMIVAVTPDSVDNNDGDPWHRHWKHEWDGEKKHKRNKKLYDYDEHDHENDENDEDNEHNEDNEGDEEEDEKKVWNIIERNPLIKSHAIDLIINMEMRKRNTFELL